MADIVLKDANGVKQTYLGIKKIKMKSTTGDDVLYKEEGGKTVGKYFVKVIDYDGTVLLDERGNAGDVFELPTPPTHDRLLFQEWSCSQEIVDNKITITDNNVMAGAVYTTKSGKTEFDITLTKTTGLVVTLKNLTGMTSIDWGDGTTDSNLSHTYADYGDYTLVISDVSELGAYVLGQAMFAANYYCTKIRLGNVTSIGGSAFENCRSLINVVIPNSITSIGTQAFNSCESLTNIVIPHSVTSMTNNLVSGAYALTNIVIPNSVTNIGNFALSSYVLTNVVIPNSVTNIGNGVLNTNYLLTDIIIPNSVTNIGNGAFQNCYLLNKYDFTTFITVPTLSGTNAFNGINPLAKIIIPDALYDEWIAATNWSNYADYIYKASEVQND